MKRIILLISVIGILSSCATRDKTVIAHRGASGYLPEHTLAGAAMAHAWGVDYIEPDIVITKDDKAVILHDTHIDTTTNVKKLYPKRARKDGRFYAVDFTLRELKRLQLSERFNYKTGKRVFPKRYPLNKSDFQIPTLEEFIELVQGLNKTTGREIGIYPELKSPEFHKKNGKDIAKIVLAILRNYGYEGENSKAIIQCFFPPTLKRLKEEFKTQIPLVLLIAENSWKESSVDYDQIRTEEGIKEASKYAFGIGPYLKHLVKPNQDGKLEKTNLVELAHKYKLKVHPYTHRKDSLPKGFQSDKEFFDFLYDEIGADGIFSDFGDIAVKYSN